MTDLTLQQLRDELAPIKAQLEALPKMRAQLDGLPLIGRKLSVIEQELRSLKAAFNDFALERLLSEQSKS
jgi:hypothetical protein